MDKSPKAFTHYEERQLGIRTIPIVKLGGTPYDMGRSIGQLFGPIIKEQMAENWEKYLQLAKDQGLDVNHVKEAILRVSARQKPYIREEAMAEIQGMYDGCCEVGAKIQSIADFSYWLAIADLSERKCCQVAAHPPATTGEKFHLRQRDLVSSLGFHNHPFIAIRHPQSASGRAAAPPFADISFIGSIGLHTGINAASVVISQVSAPQGEELLFAGEPLPLLMRELLQKGRSAKNARRLLQTTQRTTEECFLLSDPHDMILTLSTPSKIEDILPQLEGLAFWANIYKPLSDCLEEEIKLAPKEALNFEEHSLHLTNTQMQEVLDHLHGTIDLQTMLAIGQMFSHSQTVISVVFNVETRELWCAIAKGSAPASAQPYLHLMLEDYFD